MKNFFLSAVCRFSCLVVFANLFSSTILFAGEADILKKAEKDYKDGNYKDAFEGYKTLALRENGSSGRDLQQGVQCLNNLGRNNELDAFLEESIAKNQDNWVCLKAAAKSYINCEHFGFMVAGKFERGAHRGGGECVSSEMRDRARALQLFLKAMPLVEKKADASSKYYFFKDFASAMLFNRGYSEAWRLQYLSELASLPDYEPVQYGQWWFHRGADGQRGAPVDENGNPIYYKAPETFEAASNDGERWRWLLEAAKKSYPSGAEKVDYEFAGFLRNQFGVQTMAYYGANPTGSPSEAGPYSVHTLKDNETIAKLATGIKRFTLPDEFNYIKIYEKIAETGKSRADESLDALSQIYMNRRQYDSAAKYLEQCIKKYGPGHDKHRKKTLAQITGNWGTFENVKTQAAGKAALFDFKFRNASEVVFEAHRINVKELLDDVREYLKSNPRDLKWEKINLGDIGHRLVYENETKYIAGKVAEWRQKLEPAADHFDKVVTFETPFSDAGAYLLKGTLPDGNTGRVIIWIADSVIVQKQMDNGMMYFIADAASGKALVNANVEFFGYRHEYLEVVEKVLNLRKYNILTSGFSAQSDENGLVYIGSEKLLPGYQWLVTSGTADGRLAFTGFSGVWYGKYYDAEYNQKKIYCITDRPVYRPQQKVDFKFWIRHAKYDQDDNASDFANMPFTVIIKNPKNEEIFRKIFTSDAYAGICGEFELPKDATLGVYRIYIDNWGGNGNFRVEEYKKPEYEVKVEAPSAPVSLGDKITATVKAKYYFGAPVSNATVKYKVQRYNHYSEWYPPAYWDWFYGSGYWWFACDYTWYPGWSKWGCVRPCPWWMPRPSSPPELIMDNEAKISPDGTLKIEIDTAVAKAIFGDRDSRYEITAEVIDQSRRTIAGKGNVIAAREPFKVYCWVNGGYYKAGDTVDASFGARTVDGKGVKGFGDLKLMKIKYDSKGQPLETVARTWKLDTDERGFASLKLKASEAGQYRLSYTVTDAKKHSIEGGYVFTVRGGKNENDGSGAFRFNAIELVNDRAEYAPGDKVALMVNTEQKNSTVLLFIRPCNGIYLKPQMLRLEGKSAFREIEVIKKDMPNFFIEALTVSNGKIHTAVKEIIVPPEKKVLNVEVLPSKEKYKPGEKAKVRLKITDYFGTPVTSSTVVSVYDKSVEYISGGSNVPEIKAFFWKWRRSHNENMMNSLKMSWNLLKKDETGLQALGVFGGIASNDYSEITNGVGGIRRKVGESKLLCASAPAPVACKSNIAVDKCEGLPETEKNFAFEDRDANGAGTEQSPEETVTVRKNFADTAYWSVTVVPDEKGEAEFEVTMPESLTTWKVKAWSLSGGTRVGQGETEVITSKDFLIRMEVPRFFIETDEVVLSAIVHNYLPSEKKAKVILELGGDTLSAMTDKTRSASIASNGEARIDWKVKAVKEGEAVITMKALTDGDSDAMQMKFPVLVHGMMKMVSHCGNIRAGESSSPDSAAFTMEVPEKRRAEETRLEINYSPTLAGAMLDALPYLIAYPYGCTEQTLNRFLPAVITQKVIREMGISLAQIKDKRTNLNAQEIGGAGERASQWKRYKDAPVFDEKTLNDAVNEGLKRLAFMQLSDGGWGWFSGYGEYSYPHTTALVVHGLQAARANGLKLDAAMLSRGVEWLKKYQDGEIRKLENAPSKTKPWKEFADNIDAFVYMVLVDEGIKNEKMMDFLYRDRTHISVYGMSMFGIALHRQKETEKLDMIMKNIEQYLVEDEENQTAWLKLPQNNCWWYWYGSEYETQAYYLKLLSELEPKGRKASRLVKYLLNNRKHSTYWNSTRDTAFCIEAFADYLRKSGEDKPDMTIEVFMDGKLLKTVSVNQENLFSFDNKVILYGEKVGAGKHKIELKRKGSGPLYFNAYLSYFTLEDFITKAGLEIKTERNYYKLKKLDKTVKAAGARGQAVDSKVEKYEREKIENMALLKSGDLVEIELVIDSKNDYEYLMFEDMKPAGFEPCEVRSGYNGNSLGAYVEYRDTKVCFFVRALARGKHSVSYRMKAEIPGKFSALPATGAAMYAPELKANSDEIKLRVED